MTSRQQENESLTDYVKRFKSNQDGLAQAMGKDFLKLGCPLLLFTVSLLLSLLEMDLKP
jgi:hypothetical protein